MMKEAAVEYRVIIKTKDRKTISVHGMTGFFGMDFGTVREALGILVESALSDSKLDKVLNKERDLSNLDMVNVRLKLIESE